MTEDEYFEWHRRTFNPDDTRPARQRDNGNTWGAWSQRIERRLAKQGKTIDGLIDAVGDVLRDERQRSDERLAELRAELEQLRGEIDAARRLDDVVARLEKLEAAPRNLRVA